ncbi:MAG: YiiX/YebB-like N1pC/P60 family cysteine hydrolase [Myxococcota bacterium]|nr:YiiX/YebB-like N1pC/P60 family cysteine hydrolase [Myxococcota bacterium]
MTTSRALIVLGVLSAVVVMGAAVLATPTTEAREPAQDGDIIFQHSRSAQATALRHATGSPYTHVGVVFIEGGKPYVYEANGPVGKVSLNRWIARGDKRHYVRKRLKNTGGLDFRKLREEVRRFLRRPYDRGFNWSDKKIYCSELVWKAYKRAFNLEVGELKTVRDFNLKSDKVKRLLKKRKITLDMTVIAPSDMFSSDLLITVEED